MEGELTHKKGRHRKKHLYNSILQQMEFYFSDSNLSKDRFLSQLLKESPYVDLSIFLSFNKIRKLTQSIDDLQKALRKSQLLELNDEKTKVLRKVPIKEKQNVDECTIYVERIKPDATHEWLSTIFSQFGTVAYVSLPRYKRDRTIKGFAFIEFDKESEAQAALMFFERINLKIPALMPPEELLSIKTFEKDDDEEKSGETKQGKSGSENGETKEKSASENVGEKEKLVCDKEGEEVETREDTASANGEEEENPKKRKHSLDENDGMKGKKTKTKEDVRPTLEEKKNAKKENKKKSMFRELGLQILSKREWKALRNKYLNIQREKMKQLKQHLNMVKFSQKLPENPAETPENKSLEFIPGVIVKLKLEEPCGEVKKTKNEIKALSDKIKFVDARVGCDEIFIRFADAENAKAFCAAQSPFDSCVLHGDEEKQYWNKIEEERSRKFSSQKQKIRGRNKLLRKAEKVLNKHTIFDDVCD